jgi:ABC-type bacteriocin/lantibiotic exporter with double-glycine peptidase domain
MMLGSKGHTLRCFTMLVLVATLVVTVEPAWSTTDNESVQGFLQSYESKCGVVSVYAVLAKHSKTVELQTIPDNLGLTIYGTNMGHIIGYLRSQGLHVLPVEGSVASLKTYLHRSTDTSAILDFGSHWVAALSYEEPHFVIVEYPKKIAVSESALERLWTGKGILVSSSPPERSFFTWLIGAIVLIIVIVALYWRRGRRKIQLLTD